MKKSLTAVILGTVVALNLFPSCTEDELTGMDLSGDWEGSFGMYYTSRGHSYYSTDTYISFISSGSYSRGYGYQTDFYDYGPYSEIYNTFDWEVRDGVISIEYRNPQAREFNCYIRDYHLTSSYFEGYFGNSSEMFRLKKYKSYWYNDYESRYDDGWGYGGYRQESYLAPTRAEGDSIEIELPLIDHIGNIYCE